VSMGDPWHWVLLDTFVVVTYVRRALTIVRICEGLCLGYWSALSVILIPTLGNPPPF
jgi:hypothetical protein